MLLKFNIFTRYFYPKFFKSKDAPFHQEMISRLIGIYRGEQDEFLNIGFRGCSKLEPASAKILTPTGWQTMGELKEGDFVMSRYGVPTKIIYKTEPQYPKMYRVYFKDGTTYDVGEEHNHIGLVRGIKSM